MVLDKSKHLWVCRFLSKRDLSDPTPFLVPCSYAISTSMPYRSLPAHAPFWDSTTTVEPRPTHSVRASRSSTSYTRLAGWTSILPLSSVSEEQKVMEIIHADEITHVTAGHRWFTWICAEEEIDPIATFQEDVKKGCIEPDI